MFIIVLSTLLAMLPDCAMAAESTAPTTLQLLDEASGRPIAGAHCRVGSLELLSDRRGMLQVPFGADTLSFSHLSYGQWQLSGVPLAASLESGTLRRSLAQLQMQPVTVFGLRKAGGTRESLRLEDADRLSHDGGERLVASPLFGGVRKSGSHGVDPVLRGFRRDQLNIVLDGGACAAAACPNRMDPPSSQLAPNRLDQLQVLKGPHSFRYGSTLGGTVLARSEPSQWSAGDRPYGRFSLGGESNGSVGRAEAVVGQVLGKTDLALHGSWSKGSDYEDGMGMDVASRFDRSSGGLSLGGLAGDADEFRLDVSRNVAGLTDFPALPMDLRSDRTNLFRLEWRHTAKHAHLRQWTISAHGNRVRHVMDNLERPTAGRMMDARTDALTRSGSLRGETGWQGRDWVLHAGADLRREEAEGTRRREVLMGPMAGRVMHDTVWNGGRITRAGLFAEGSLQKGEWTRRFSARLEHSRAEARRPDAGFASRQGELDHAWTDPSLSLGLGREWAGGWQAGAWLAHARRSPGLTETYINSFPVGSDAYDLLGTPGLASEANTQLDLRLGRRLRSAELEATIYVSRVGNFISSRIDTSLAPVMPSSPGVRRFVNLEEARFAGFELEAIWLALPDLRLSAQAAYTHAEDVDREEPLPEIPPLEGLLRIEKLWQRLALDTWLAARFVRNQDRVSQAFGESPTPGFARLDGGLNWNAPGGVQLALAVRNLLDREIREHLSRPLHGSGEILPSPGRSVLLTLSWDAMP